MIPAAPPGWRVALGLLIVLTVGCGQGQRSGSGPAAPVIPPTTRPSTVTLPAAQEAVAEAASVPVIAAGLPAGAFPLRVSTAAPVRVSLPEAGIDAPVVARGTEAGTGAFDLPPDPTTVAWYRDGPRPGAAGSAVLAAHVDYGGRLGAFAGLLGLEPGAAVEVGYDDGTTARFEVVDRRSYAKSSLPVDELFRREGVPSLVLVTCGGAFDRASHSYEDNVVVTAVPAR